jgi:hypothetical protein
MVPAGACLAAAPPADQRRWNASGQSQDCGRSRCDSAIRDMPGGQGRPAVLEAARRQGRPANQPRLRCWDWSQPRGSFPVLKVVSTGQMRHAMVANGLALRDGDNLAVRDDDDVG